MTDPKLLADPDGTPEDVATLYSWANLHGAKYRDFSAARAQTREKARQRAEQAASLATEQAIAEGGALASGDLVPHEAQPAAGFHSGPETPRFAEPAQPAEDFASYHAASTAEHETYRGGWVYGEAAEQPSEEAIEHSRSFAAEAAQRASDLAADEAAPKLAPEQQAHHAAPEAAHHEAAHQDAARQVAEHKAAERAAQLEASHAAQLAELQAAQRAAEEAAHRAAEQAAELEALYTAERAARLEAEQAARRAAQEAAEQAAMHAAEQARLAQAQLEQARLEQARLEQERLEHERIEAARQEAEQAAAHEAQRVAETVARLEAEQAEQQEHDRAAHEAAELAAQHAAEEAQAARLAEQQEMQQAAEQAVARLAELQAAKQAGQSHHQPESAPAHQESSMPSRHSWAPPETPETNGKPAWLTPEPAEPASQPVAQSPLPPAPEDTLQGQRDRLTSRWFALRGIFEAAPLPPAEPVAPPVVSRAPAMAIFSLAGGVGKTSLVATLGRALSARGERVLLVDTAAFGLLPFFFGATDQRPGVLRTFNPPGVSTDAPIQLVTLDPDSLANDAAGQETLTAEIVKFSRGVSRIIVDLATASGSTTRRIMRMSPLVLVPVIPDMNSVVSVSSIDAFFEHNSNPNAKPSLPFYVLNQFDASLPLHLDVREVLREQLAERLLPFALGRTPAMSEALAEGMTIVDYAPNSGLAEDFAALAGWVKSLAAPATTSYRGVRWSER